MTVASEARPGYSIIHLADDEWGNETMLRVALEYFGEHPDVAFVEVYEHAGWYLGFRRDGTIWSTANDMARPKGPYPNPIIIDMERRDH